VNLPFYIAKRYLFKKKTNNVVNVIALMSVIGVAIGTTALVIVLSVFNGFEKLVTNLYKSFDPDIKITSLHGKTMQIDTVFLNNLTKTKGVALYSKVLEEKVLLHYNDKQYVATIKGVDSLFDETTGFDKTIKSGTYFYNIPQKNIGVIGQGISYMLSVGANDNVTPVQVFVPKKGLGGSLNPKEAFSSKAFYPTGVFSIQADFDTKYIVTPIEFTQELLGVNKNEVSAIELKTTSSANQMMVKKSLEKLIGDQYVVKSQLEQHEALFKMMKTEKIAVIIIFTFILIIATFTMASAIIMLIIDKERDIRTLINLGMDLSKIQKVYFFNGFLNSCIGSVAGMVIGTSLSWIQEKFKIIKLGSGDGFVVSYYPVSVNGTDLLIVFIIITIVGALMSFIPTMVLKRKLLYV